MKLQQLETEIFRKLSQIDELSGEIDERAKELRKHQVELQRLLEQRQELSAEKAG